MEEATIIRLPKIVEPQSNLTFVEQDSNIPFKIKRVYWIYDVLAGQILDGYAFKEQRELIVALSGRVDVVINDSKSEQHIHLNSPNYGLYLPNGYWRHMENFSANSVVLVLSSSLFNKDDYICEFEEFLKFVTS